MSAQPMEARLAHLEGAFDQVSERLNNIDRTVASLAQRLDGRVDALAQRLDGRIDFLTQRMDVRFNWLTGVVIATWITTILTILFHH